MISSTASSQRVFYTPHTTAKAEFIESISMPYQIRLKTSASNHLHQTICIKPSAAHTA